MTIEMPTPEVQSVGVQCNLLAPPPLRMLKNLEDVNEESLPSEVEETDLDICFPGRKHNRVSPNGFTPININ